MSKQMTDIKEICEEIVFFTPIYTGGVDDFRDKLLPFVDGLKKETSLENSNNGGWHSRNFYPNGGGLLEKISYPPVLYPIFEQITQHMRAIYRKWGIQHEPKLANCWFISNRKGDWNVQHNHPGALFSGSVYLKVPENSGKIFFVRDSILLKGSAPQDFQAKITDYTKGSWSITPEVNKCIIFPWHLEHYVDVNRTEDEDDERIVLAFNYV